MEEKFYYAIGFLWPDTGTLGFRASFSSEIHYGTEKDAEADLKYANGDKETKYFIVKLNPEII